MRITTSKLIPFWGILISIALFSASSPNAGPSLVSYQGQLTDALGNPLDTTVNITFRIYDAASGGTLIWEEVQMSVAATDGLFEVTLGSVDPVNNGVDESIFAGGNRYLAIAVGSDPELSPRTRLVTVPYSHRVTTVDGSTGGIISGDVSIQSDLSVSGKATIGTGHTNNGDWSFVAGHTNTSNADTSTISGGTDNMIPAGGVLSTIGGGRENVASGQISTIGGGQFNMATGDLSTVAGGIGNTASGDQSSILGGSGSQATANHSTVGGGSGNFADSSWATIAGGEANIARGRWAFIGGGRDHQVNASDFSTIGGGQSNFIDGDNATIPGGKFNRARGTHSFAAGFRATANNYGTFVWADSTDVEFGSTGNNQFLIRAAGGVGIGTNSPTQQLEVAGTVYSTSGGFKFPDGTVQMTAGGGGSSDGDWTIAGNNVFSTLSGNVGIGNSSPAFKLDVNGTMRVTGGGSSFPKLTLEYATGGFPIFRIYGNSTSDRFRFSTNSGDVSYLAGPGNVGVGTKTPTEKLQVAGTVYSTSGGFKFPDNTVQATATDPANFNGATPALDVWSDPVTPPSSSGATVTIKSASITVPGSGKIIAIGSVDLFCNSGCTVPGQYVSSYWTISSSSTGSAQSGAYSFGFTHFNNTNSSTRMQVFNVSTAGTFTFYMRGRRSGGLGGTNVGFFRGQLLLSFIPN